MRGWVFAGLLFVGSAQATSFAPMSMKERVQSSDLIIEVETEHVDCRTPEGKVLEPGKDCTGPGVNNRLHYVAKAGNVLFKRGSIQVPEKIEFSFQGMGITTVPDDGYKFEKGARIYFLRQVQGQLIPLHEAFFDARMDDKKEIVALIKKSKKRK